MFLLPNTYHYSNEINKGNEAIKLIDDYKFKNGRLPNSLSDIGIKEKLSGPIYYDKVSEDKYIISFGMSLGESGKYYSEKRKWVIP